MKNGTLSKLFISGSRFGGNVAQADFRLQTSDWRKSQMPERSRWHHKDHSTG
jgi:hypothetical protein